MKEKVLALLCMMIFATANVKAQEYRKVLSPLLSVGVSMNIDANGLHAGRYKESQVPDKPSFTAGFLAMGRLGRSTDMFNLTLGLGYRGLFDQAPPHEFIYNPSYSDYLLYSRDHTENKDGSEVRPIGGQLVIPAELHLNMFRVGEESSVFIGVGAEYGLKIYRSKRYADYFGATVMNKSSLSVQPMVGYTVDTEVLNFTVSLYFKHYLQNPYNREVIPIGKFSQNHLGLQIAFTFGNF